MFHSLTFLSSPFFLLFWFWSLISLLVSSVRSRESIKSFIFVSIYLSFSEKYDFTINIIHSGLSVNEEFTCWSIFMNFCSKFGGEHKIVVVKLSFCSNSLTLVHSRFDIVIFYNFLFPFLFSFILFTHVSLIFLFVCCGCLRKTMLFF